MSNDDNVNVNLLFTHGELSSGFLGRLNKQDLCYDRKAEHCKQRERERGET